MFRAVGQDELYRRRPRVLLYDNRWLQSLSLTNHKLRKPYVYELVRVIVEIVFHVDVSSRQFRIQAPGADQKNCAFFGSPSSPSEKFLLLINFNYNL